MSSPLLFLPRIFMVAGCSQSQHEKANILLSFMMGDQLATKPLKISSKHYMLEAKKHQDLLLAYCLQRTEFSTRIWIRSSDLCCSGTRSTRSFLLANLSISISTLQSLDKMLCFRRSGLSLRCLVTYKQGSVMHIPGPPTHIVTYCLINRV